MIEQRGYARPDLLVDTAWLAQRLDDPNIRIVDMDVPDAFRRAHLPGALNPRVHHYFKLPDDERFVMTPEQFQGQMEAMGIGDEHQVIAYDASRNLYAARLWWLFLYFGHSNIKVLDGGWQKWLQEQRPVTMREQEHPRSRFTVNVSPDVIASAEYIMARLGSEEFQPFDVRSMGEWNGTNSRGNVRVGHVPGAAHREWLNNVADGPTPEFRPADELRQTFGALGVTPDKEIVTYCQGGIRAAHAMFTLTLLGYPNVRIYDGSMRDWANREDTPLVAEV